LKNRLLIWYRIILILWFAQLYTFLIMLVDTHAHIYGDEFKDDIDTIIANAIKNGVGKIFLPNEDTETIPEMLKLADRYPDICYPMIGLHPSAVEEDYKPSLDIVGEWLTKRKFYGIGEIGIDLYWDRTRVAQQKEAFRQQLRMAGSFNLPVSIHMRNSFQEVYSILSSEQNGSLSGVFHCFSGTKEDAGKAIDIGFYLGIGGSVTFKNSHLPEILKETDIKNIVLETDAPFLAPVPRRGMRNESGYLIYTAEKVAEIYGLTMEAVSEITTRNALRLFNLNY
jgi:TatD DNase family protein